MLDCSRHFAEFVGKKKGKERKEDAAKYADEIKQIWPRGLCVGGFTECVPQLHHWRANSLFKTAYSTEVAAKQPGQG